MRSPDRTVWIRRAPACSGLPVDGKNHLPPARVLPATMLTKLAVKPPKGAYCFGCNQPFEGGAPAVRFESDLLSAADRTELSHLYFHPGHMIRYARRRNWTDLAAYMEGAGVANF